MNRFCLPWADKRGPLAVSGCEAAKAERVLRAPFVLTEAWFVRHNAALAALEACAAVTNLFGLERHQVTAAMCPSSRAARPGALRAVNSFRAAVSVGALGTSGFKFRESAIYFDDFAPLWVDTSWDPLACQ